MVLGHPLQRDRGGGILKLKTWKQISTEPVVEPDYLINPYVVREGITFLWGKWGRGKSPLTWWMARAIGSGEPFFGLPTRVGKVLYVELDSPENYCKPRLQQIPPADNVWFWIRKPLIFPHAPADQDQELKEVAAQIDPDVVFVNTLRKCHDLDDKDSRTPKLVYTYWQMAFPRSALVFVHHDKKEHADPKLKAGQSPSETFSGSQAWINDAQIGLRLDGYQRKKRTSSCNCPTRECRTRKQSLNLVHHKAQGSIKLNPLPLWLDTQGNGTTMTCVKQEDLDLLVDLIKQGLPVTEVDKKMAFDRCMSVSWARKLRADVQDGKYPGSPRWLAGDGDDGFED